MKTELITVTIVMIPMHESAFFIQEGARWEELITVAGGDEAR